MMKGRIWVESEGLGKGSAFQFTAVFESNEVPEPWIPNQENVAVLIADDNEMSRHSLRNLAESLGLKPTLTSNGHEALEALRRQSEIGQPFFMALLDADMPELDGFGIAERLGLEGALATQVALLLPASASLADRTRCRDLGVGLLLKPPRRRELLAFVEGAGKMPDTNEAAVDGPVLV